MRYIVNNGSVQDVLCTLKNYPPTSIEVVQIEIEYETQHKNRATVLNKLNVIKRKLESDGKRI